MRVCFWIFQFWTWPREDHGHRWNHCAPQIQLEGKSKPWHRPAALETTSGFKWPDSPYMPPYQENCPNVSRSFFVYFFFGTLKGLFSRKRILLLFYIPWTGWWMRAIRGEWLAGGTWGRPGTPQEGLCLTTSSKSICRSWTRTPAEAPPQSGSPTTCSVLVRTRFNSIELHHKNNFPINPNSFIF